ncbi:uncharacterized protein VSU04_013584 [Chlamydotis macqueenii]
MGVSAPWCSQRDDLGSQLGTSQRHCSSSASSAPTTRLTDGDRRALQRVCFKIKDTEEEKAEAELMENYAVAQLLSAQMFTRDTGESSKLVVIIRDTVGMRFALLHQATCTRYVFACLHARRRPCQTALRCHSPRLETTAAPWCGTELSTAPRTNVGYYPRRGSAIWPAATRLEPRLCAEEHFTTESN